MDPEDEKLCPSASLVNCEEGKVNSALRDKAPPDPGLCVSGHLCGAGAYWGLPQSTCSPQVYGKTTWPDRRGWGSEWGSPASAVPGWPTFGR